MNGFANGRYVPNGSTSHGGTGSVIVCSDKNLDRLVAIKFLQPQSEKRRLMDEIEALQRIRSKNVVEIYDVVVVPPDNRVGVVQEFLSGRGLDELAPLIGSSAERLRLLFQIANGLADIHHQGQIHRDLKPNNMRLDSEGLVNIFDFDLSRQEGPSALTRGFRGTPGYAAPELYNFGAVVLEKSADIYSFAATALFLLTGTLPPELLEVVPNPQAWLEREGFAGTTLLPLLGGEHELAAMLNRCLAMDPVLRPAASDLRDTLATLLLRGRHRAQLVAKEKLYVVDAKRPSTRIRIGSLGEMILAYDGLRFSATWVSGDVSINNVRLSSSVSIPGSCVLGFGADNLPAWQREFITLDVSHPEVVL